MVEGSLATERGVTERFVLVHGAWHGGWCWRDVRTELERRGHEVHAPTLPGLAERAGEMSRELTLEVMVADAVSFLERRDLREVVLVGHSFGGGVISGVADRARERLRRLVFLDAVLVEDGETLFDTISSETVEQRRRGARAFDGGVSMPPPPGAAFGLGDAHKWAIERLTPQPLASYESPLRLAHPVGNGLPAVYVECTDPGYPTLQSSRDRAAAYGWPRRRLAMAHDCMVLDPAATAAALLDGRAGRTG